MEDFGVENEIHCLSEEALKILSYFHRSVTQYWTEIP